MNYSNLKSTMPSPHQNTDKNHTQYTAPLNAMDNQQYYAIIQHIDEHNYSDVIEGMLQFCEHIKLRMRVRYIAKVYLDNFLKEESPVILDTVNELVIGCIVTAVKVHQKWHFETLLAKIYDSLAETINIGVVQVYEQQVNNYQRNYHWNQGLNPFNILSINLLLPLMDNPQVSSYIDSLLLMVLIHKRSREADACLTLFVAIVVIMHQQPKLRMFVDSNQRLRVYVYLRVREMLSDQGKKALIEEMVIDTLKQFNLEDQYDPKLLSQ